MVLAASAVSRSLSLLLEIFCVLWSVVFQIEWFALGWFHQKHNQWFSMGLTACVSLTLVAQKGICVTPTHCWQSKLSVGSNLCAEHKLCGHTHVASTIALTLLSVCLFGLSVAA